MTQPPTIDGTFGATEWANAAQYGLPHGPVYFENDATNLYVLFDMSADTTLDSTPPNVDGFSVFFDINRDGVGDQGVEVVYGNCRNGTLSTRSFLIDAGACTWTSCQATAAVVARGFGPAPATATNHVIFEVAIPLSEVQLVGAGNLLNIGLGYVSINPAFTDAVPANACSFFSYLVIQLGTPPVPVLGRAGLALLALLIAGAGLWWLRRSLAG